MQRFNVEFRSEVQGNTLHGYAAVFNQVAKLPRHLEMLSRNAFDKVLKDGADVRALVNHDPSQLIGRSASGTLRLETDDHGLHFEVDLPDTQVGRDLRTLLERGDVTGASFGFVPGADEWSQAPDGSQLRTHTSVAQLLDVSPVTYPAYEGTAVALRAYDFSRPSGRSQLVRARARLLPN